MSVNYTYGENAAKLALEDLTHTSALRRARLEAGAPDFALSTGLAIVGAISAAGQLGLGVAKAARSDDGAQTLEIEIDNESQLPVVVHETKTDTIHVVQFPRPIGPGESETVVLSRNDGFENNKSQVTLEMLIGGEDTYVSAEYTFRLDGDGMWQVTAEIDGEPSGDDWPGAGDGKVKLYGAAVSSTSNFSIYTSPNDKTDGFLTLNVLDHDGSSS